MLTPNNCGKPLVICQENAANQSDICDVKPVQSHIYPSPSEGSNTKQCNGILRDSSPEKKKSRKTRWDKPGSSTLPQPNFISLPYQKLAKQQESIEVHLVEDDESDASIEDIKKAFIGSDKEYEPLSDSEEEEEKVEYIRSSPADPYYKRDDNDSKVVWGTKGLKNLCDKFEETLVRRSEKVRASKPPVILPPRKVKPSKDTGHVCGESEEASDEDEDEDEETRTKEELERKIQHPERLHADLWHNEFEERNDGPSCRCSLKARRSGIRHGYYMGEEPLSLCEPLSNNADKLYHYRITVAPPINFLVKFPCVIEFDEHEFVFEGFSLFSHSPLARFPTCSVIRFNIKYTILYNEEPAPENCTVREMDLLYKYLFVEILELFDLNMKGANDPNGCDRFHLMPRFVRKLPYNGKEVLSLCEVLQYFLKNSKPIVTEEFRKKIKHMSEDEWNDYTDKIKGMMITRPGMRPSTIRLDQLDRDRMFHEPYLDYPEVVHFGIRPLQLSYAGNPDYQKQYKFFVKLRHLMANKPKLSSTDRSMLSAKEQALREIRGNAAHKRDVTVVLSSRRFYATGITCDIVQHAMLIPVLAGHLRFHQSLNKLEEKIGYTFKNRYLLQLALTHPSYRENFGTNRDHARNTLTNCGIRQPQCGDRRIHYMNTRKRGINTLISIMYRFGEEEESESGVEHSERLEFLGDAVVEFLSTVHLFLLFPGLEEGGLATYRAAIVQNQHLSVLAEKLGLQHFLLFTHGSDLCHDTVLKHALSNCFEALMGAIFLDGGIEVSDRVFGEALFEDKLLTIWNQLPEHPLQEQEPLGDRKWIPKIPFLQHLTRFEQSIGVEFRHIRLLARSFTDRSVGFNNLTIGSNQRLEFLGDTVLQLLTSEYLYKHFPNHHEGHLSLLRSTLVNNRTQSYVCDDLDMVTYAMPASQTHGKPATDLKIKDKADLLEAFLGTLYIDKGLEECRTVCAVCFFPRLQHFIMNQDWNDPKSKLQQCCLTLRTVGGGEPDIPVYKVIQFKGPTNSRVYNVAVYFRNKRLAKGTGQSIQRAEMAAAKKALEACKNLFPQLHQKRIRRNRLRSGSPRKPRYETRGRSSGRGRRGRSGSRSSQESRRSKERSRCRSSSPPGRSSAHYKHRRKTRSRSREYAGRWRTRNCSGEIRSNRSCSGMRMSRSRSASRGRLSIRRSRSKSRGNSIPKNGRSRSKSRLNSGARSFRSRSRSQRNTSIPRTRNSRSRSGSKTNTRKLSIRRSRSRSRNWEITGICPTRKSRSRSRSRGGFSRNRSHSRSKGGTALRLEICSTSVSENRRNSSQRQARNSRSRSRNKVSTIQRPTRSNRSRSRSKASTIQRSARNNRSRSRSKVSTVQCPARNNRSRSRNKGSTTQRPGINNRSRSRSIETTARRLTRNGRSRSRSRESTAQLPTRNNRSCSRTRESTAQCPLRNGRSRSRSRRTTACWTRYSRNRSKSQENSPKRWKRSSRSSSIGLGNDNVSDRSPPANRWCSGNKSPVAGSSSGHPFKTELIDPSDSLPKAKHAFSKQTRSVSEERCSRHRTPSREIRMYVNSGHEESAGVKQERVTTPYKQELCFQPPPPTRSCLINVPPPILTVPPPINVPPPILTAPPPSRPCPPFPPPVEDGQIYHVSKCMNSQPYSGPRCDTYKQEVESNDVQSPVTFSFRPDCLPPGYTIQGLSMPPPPVIRPPPTLCLHFPPPNYMNPR